MNKIIEEQRHKLKYNILMIISDGEIYDDLDENIDELVEDSFLPLSVIIISKGNADLSNIVILGEYDKILVNSRRVKSFRDLAQLSHLLKYVLSGKFTSEVLEEVSE